MHGELPISKDFIRYRANFWFQPPLCFLLSLGRERDLKNYFISHSPQAAVSIPGVLPALYLSELLYWQKENTNIFGEEKLQEGCWWSSGCPGVCAGTFGEKIGDVLYCHAFFCHMRLKLTQAKHISCCYFSCQRGSCGVSKASVWQVGTRSTEKSTELFMSWKSDWNFNIITTWWKMDPFNMFIY